MIGRDRVDAGFSQRREDCERAGCRVTSQCDRVYILICEWSSDRNMNRLHPFVRGAIPVDEADFGVGLVTIAIGIGQLECNCRISVLIESNGRGRAVVPIFAPLGSRRGIRHAGRRRTNRDYIGELAACVNAVTVGTKRVDACVLVLSRISGPKLLKCLPGGSLEDRGAR
jgi:hypothetical protein